METPGAFFGRATRILLIAAGITAWAYVLSTAGGLRSHPSGPAAPVARVLVPGTESVLALQQAAETAQGAVDPGSAHNPRNLLFTVDHSVYTSVGVYSDCTGRAPLTHAAAAVDVCIPGVRYFIGHNPGVFTGLMSAGVGTLIGYYDGAGRLHRYEVVADRTWLRSAGVPSPARAGVAAQFQTCVTADGSVDRILDAVET